MNKPLENSDRLQYLVAARALALLLGIVFHASLSFMPMFIGWAVMDISTSSTVTLLVLVSHSFRLELFFLLAGYFSRMSCNRRGGYEFIKSRLLRLAMPFCLGWFVLRPLLVSGWQMGAQSMQGEVNVKNALDSAIATLTAIPKDLFVGTHLWFLYYLLLISFIVLVARYIVGLNTNLKKSVSSLLYLTIAAVCKSRYSLFILALPAATILWFMQTWGVDTPDKSLIPDAAVTLLYGYFFAFGWLLQGRQTLLQAFIQLNLSRVFICAIAIAITCWLSQYQMEKGHYYYVLLKFGFVITYAAMMWSLVSIVLGLCERFLNKPDKKLQYLAEASYWLYLIHLPIVIWLQIAFAELPLHWSVKLASICVITVGLSLMLYEFFVRSTFIGKALNGKRLQRSFLKLRFFSGQLRRR
ncbi:hypothetical protein SAMN06297280_1799 [Arsukibacterium tuosuense]|uniref:Acyltransferase 3 domain-containing protein n=1 Tax=Arsukibacterium tuosuense TaxID=1323745 RepID=A0A285ITB7_9GAMM|nr:acyltransferase family protein [Arsukibacterium tuosuense]SNY51260.1 hypothetical protein SAMN06297280_1799 [Arsukibacterium tuosuense]